MEMVALDHALLENVKFTARAARISYTQAKGLLILEGDGRSKAELSRQKYPTAPISSVRALKIEVLAGYSIVGRAAAGGRRRPARFQRHAAARQAGQLQAQQVPAILAVATPTPARCSSSRASTRRGCGRSRRAASIRGRPSFPRRPLARRRSPSPDGTRPGADGSRRRCGAKRGRSCSADGRTSGPRRPACRAGSSETVAYWHLPCVGPR